jgi:hypothetical protein
MVTSKYVEERSSVADARARALQRIGDAENVRPECRSIVEEREGPSGSRVLKVLRFKEFQSC